jgi:ABC-type multidrug transport system ATPase subunit
MNEMFVKFMEEVKGSGVPKLESGNYPGDENMHIPVLEVKDVHKRFGRHYVLRGVGFEVYRGEIVGITGENGSGKSTLLKIIVGMLPSDRGEVYLRGTFGYCPQEPLFFEDLTMEENIEYFSVAYGLDQVEGVSRGNELMKMLRCEQFKSKLSKHLSGGTRQKLNLILSLLHDPDILILDEPYQGFDYESYLSFWEIAKKLRERGKSILVVSHLVYDRAYFTKIYKLEEGRLKHV